MCHGHNTHSDDEHPQPLTTQDIEEPEDSPDVGGQKRKVIDISNASDESQAAHQLPVTPKKKARGENAASPGKTASTTPSRRRTAEDVQSPHGLKKLFQQELLLLLDQCAP